MEKRKRNTFLITLLNMDFAGVLFLFLRFIHLIVFISSLRSKWRNKKCYECREAMKKIEIDERFPSTFAHNVQ